MERDGKKNVKKLDKNKLNIKKLHWMVISAVILVIMGCILITAGFIVPPSGEIHPTVLTALGECFTFSGSLFGIKTNYDIKTERMRMEHGIDDEEINE